jgi:uncharacterized protein (TIGR00730 family)
MKSDCNIPETSAKKEGGMRRIHLRADNGPIDEWIGRLIDEAGGIKRPSIVREMILMSLKAGQEDRGGVNLKLMNTSLKEMRYTAKVFGAYPNMKKVSVFGSARTRPDQEAYKTAFLLGRRLAENGFMVITGGGAGIMQAVNEGAGPEHSFGITIRLPFEQANPTIQGSPRSVNYKYFFNRKVAFIKESDAVVLFPGGFGTLDEAMELLTLVQTGKRNPLPILLAEESGGTYWLDWVRFVEGTVLPEGYIGEADLRLFQRVESIEEAVESIGRFYSRYHSLRYIGDQLVIRLESAMEPHAVERLRSEFSDILAPKGEAVLSGPLPIELDETETLHLPRLVLSFNRRDFARLKELIDAVNRA